MKVFCSIHDLYERQNSQRTSHLFFGSYEIWSNKLKLLYNKPHRDTEGTELKAISRRCWRHIERWSCSVQTPDSSWDKRFGHKVTNKTRNQHPSLHTPSVPPCHHLLCFNNPPHPPAPSVIILQSSKLRRLFSLANLLKGPFFSQNYTEEQNSQRPTETLSQPMTQTLSTKIVYNVLWYLSSACRRLWVPPLAAWPLFICENLWEIKLPTA